MPYRQQFLKLLTLAMLGLRCGIACAQETLISLSQQTVQQAVAATEGAVVRIDTVGGVDLVGELLTATGPTTGVVVRSDGWIITSQFNFLSKPSSILVTLGDGRKFAARITAQDDSRMLTLLKIEADGLPVLTPTPKSEMQVGQTAIALGRTYDPGFPNVAVGIISALNRVWGKAVQTDAHTSPVNYGGPLIDLSGRCLGIIVPLSPDDQGVTAGVEWYDSGIGFAVPLEDLQQVLNRLIQGETLKRGLLGGSFEDRGPLSGEAKLIRVRPESPLDLAGVMPDDVIVGINGTPVEKLSDLKHVLGAAYAGDTVALNLKRGDESFERSITLAGELKTFRFPYLGLLADQSMSGDEPESRVRLRAVFPESPAAQAGLQAGDLIEQINDQPITSRDQLAERLRRIEVGGEVRMNFRRGGEMQSITCTTIPFPDELPAAVSTQLIEPPDNEPGAATGRLNERLPGEGGLEFWAYVPENYRTDRTWGLLVWLHPSANTLEAQTLRQWSDLCEQRGLILVGPRAGGDAGWSPDQTTSVTEVIAWMQERYRIDPARVAVLGSGDSVRMAVDLAFNRRSLIRGLALHAAPLSAPPPDNDPDYPLQVVVAAKDPGPTVGRRDRIGASVDILREAGFPTSRITLPGDDMTEGLTPETVASLALWLETLDRL